MQVGEQHKKIDPPSPVRSCQPQSQWVPAMNSVAMHALCAKRNGRLTWKYAVALSGDWVANPTTEMGSRRFPSLILTVVPLGDVTSTKSFVPNQWGTTVPPWANKRATCAHGTRQYTNYKEINQTRSRSMIRMHSTYGLVQAPKSTPHTKKKKNAAGMRDRFLQYLLRGRPDENGSKMHCVIGIKKGKTISPHVV